MFQPKPILGGAARGMFLKSAGLNETDACSKSVNNRVVEVLELCRGVPLTLSVAGAQVHSHYGAPMKSLKRLLWHIQKGGLPICQEETAEEYPCFAETVRGSLEGIAAFLEKNAFVMWGLHRHVEQRITDKSMTTCEFAVENFHRLCILP